MKRDTHSREGADDSEGFFEKIGGRIDRTWCSWKEAVKRKRESVEKERRKAS